MVFCGIQLDDCNGLCSRFDVCYFFQIEFFDRQVVDWIFNDFYLVIGIYQKSLEYYIVGKLVQFVKIVCCIDVYWICKVVVFKDMFNFIYIFCLEEEQKWNVCFI